MVSLTENRNSKATATVEDVFSDIKQHFGAPTTSNAFALAEMIRKHHPDHHLTIVDGGDCDLLGYAEAGHATAELATDGDTFSIELTYRVAKKLTEALNFGHFKYTWNGTRFLLYCVRAPSTCGSTDYGFLLAPRAEGVMSRGHHSLTDALLLAAGKWSTQLHEEIYVFDGGLWTKNKQLWRDVRAASWEDVVLDARMKTALVEDVHGFFDSRDLYSEFGVPWKRGIIFHGLPGNGKTISIKALMAALEHRRDSVQSLYVKSLDARAGHQWSIRAIFSMARAIAPCLLIFEDLDSLVTDKTRSYFLNEVDGLQSNEGILMIGSTNHLGKLDPAIRDRPSRFDRKYHFKLPERTERLAYAQYWQKKLMKHPRVIFPDQACEAVSDMTDGFSFAYLKELFIAALLVIARGGKGEDTPDDNVTNGVKTVSTASETDSALEKVAGDGIEPASNGSGEVASSEPAANATALRLKALDAYAIPDALRDNVLVKVMRQQVRLLLVDMDNNTAPVHRVSSAGGMCLGQA